MLVLDLECPTTTGATPLAHSHTIIGYTAITYEYCEQQHSWKCYDYGRPIPRSNERSYTPAGPAPSMGQRTPFDVDSPVGWDSSSPHPEDFDGRTTIPSRGPTADYGRNSPAPSAMGRSPISSPTNGYQPFNPNNRSASSAAPHPNSSVANPAHQQRNMTDPGRGPPQDYFTERPGTAQSGRQPPNSQRGPPRDLFNERPGTAQSNTQPVNSQRGRPQDYFETEQRAGTPQGTRQPPLNSAKLKTSLLWQ